MKFCALLVGLLLGIGIVHPSLAVTRIRDDKGGSLGLIFSGRDDTDISFDYGILSPRCRRADFADLKQLQITLASP